MRARLGGAVGCALIALAGCTSSGAGTGGSSLPGPLPATSSIPTTATTSSSSPAPKPSKSAPLSRFEGDPGVAAFRTWADVTARTINSGRYISPQLRRLMTPTVAKEMKETVRSDIGLHYPGPVPFTPVRVVVTSTTSRKLDVCMVSTGFAEKPGTHKPAKKLKVIAVHAAETQIHGRWLLSTLLSTNAFSCSGVKVPMPTF